MNNLIMAKANEVESMNQYQLEKLKQQIGLSKDLSSKAEMYLMDVIEKREMYLASKSESIVEMSELREGEVFNGKA